MKWEEVIKGDWLYNPSTKRFCRVVDVTGVGPNTITIVPLSDISKRFIINQETFERHNLSTAYLQWNTSSGFFNVTGHGYIELPEVLKNRKIGDSLPKELKVYDYPSPSPFPSMSGNSHASDAFRYSTGINVDAAPNINPIVGTMKWEKGTDKTEFYKKPCNHQWRSTMLFFTTVYDCSICGCKKEDHTA